MFTAKQIAALKYVIFHSQDGDNLLKRILAFLIDRSENLTKEICLVLVADREGYTGEEIDAAAHRLHGMQSANGTTHLDQILHVMGADLCFSCHYGDVDPTRTHNPFSAAGQFCGLSESIVKNKDALAEGMTLRYTFWLAKKIYPPQGIKLIATTRFELEQINLDKPGLYSHEPV